MDVEVAQAFASTHTHTHIHIYENKLKPDSKNRILSEVFWPRLRFSFFFHIFSLPGNEVFFVHKPNTWNVNKEDHVVCRSRVITFPRVRDQIICVSHYFNVVRNKVFSDFVWIITRNETTIPHFYYHDDQILLDRVNVILW